MSSLQEPRLEEDSSSKKVFVVDITTLFRKQHLSHSCIQYHVTFALSSLRCCGRMIIVVVLCNWKAGCQVYLKCNFLKDSCGDDYHLVC
jgi:hypothetical protein